MRHITEQSAKFLIRHLETFIEQNKKPCKRSLKTENEIRLAGIVLNEIKKNKTNKNKTHE